MPVLPLRPRRGIARLSRTALHPSQLIAGSFALTILIGTLLLTLPIATRNGQRIPLVDAFFTATSATCVTGLAIYDTGTRFSTFGQLVILACIQIGGLGLMTLTTVFVVLAGRRLAIADRVAVQESFHHVPTGKPAMLIRYIIVATLLTELLGALLLMWHWLRIGRFTDPAAAAYSAVFHSISAFCNAGFALFPDNLIHARQDPVTLLIISALIIAGGLGFLVSLDAKEYVQRTLFERYWSRRMKKHVRAIRPRPRLSTHSKLVLSVTLLLLAVGTVTYYVLERQRLFHDLNDADAWINSFFCAVTPRTAGFNSVDYAAMSGAALLCTMVLMFIGASPGSTGGGIKTSTFGLLVLHAIARWRGYSGTHAFRRTVARDSLDKSETIVISFVGLVILAGSVLMATETHAAPPDESRRLFLPLIFETISALGTVGLSVGVTPTLTPVGKIVVALLMYIGRIGPLTLALAISNRRRQHQFQYAEESIMVG